MKSKEALFKIASYCPYNDVINDTLGIIDKDLEILDLIKKHKHIFLYAIFINQDNYCGQEVRELEKRDEFKKEINKIKEYSENECKVV